MLVTLFGISTLVSSLQLMNARSPMLVTPVAIVTLSSAEQPQNAKTPILVTLEPIATSFNVYAFWLVVSYQVESFALGTNVLMFEIDTSNIPSVAYSWTLLLTFPLTSSTVPSPQSITIGFVVSSLYAE